jgi:hypothetical protein
LSVFARWSFRRVWPLAGTLLACLLVAPAAQAGVLAGVTAADCERNVSQPFAPWDDTNWYFLAPNGDLGAGDAGWRLSGASVVDENSPLGGGGGAVRLADGDSATTPPVCVGLDTPTMRFFARNDGAAEGTLHVAVRLEGPNGIVLSVPIGDVSGGGEWAPVPALPIVAKLLGVIEDWATPVAFSFQPDGGDWLVDDVYVDPYGKG